MIRAGWRRVGINPAAWVVLLLAGGSMVLSRGAGSGWLVVLAAVFLGTVAVSAALAVLGLWRVRVELDVPTDAIAGEVITIGVRLRSPVPQLRTVAVGALDHTTHAIEQRPTPITVLAPRRELVTQIPLEIRAGLPLGLIRPARRLTITPPTPLAVAPVPAVVSLLDALGQDAAAEVRTVRAYVPGDAARLVHWRSTARRGELMVRELETAELLRGATLEVRVTLSGDRERVEAAASEAAGLAITALDAGLRVELLTHEVDGPRRGFVRSRRDVGRRLAAATPGVPPAANPAGDGRHIVEVPR